MFEDKFDDKIIDNIEEEKKFPEFPLCLAVVSAENSCLFDTDGKKYLDLTSNRENNPFGYSNKFAEADNHFLDTQLFNSQSKIKLSEALRTLTGLEKTYFSSDLDELYHITSELISVYIDKTDKNKVLISANSFTQDYYQIENAKTEIIPINNSSILKTLFSREVGAVVIQPVQIGVDIAIADQEYLKEVRSLCDRNKAVLILDCSNLSPLRLNQGLFNFNNDVKPDLLIVSKGFAQGLPLSCLILSDKFSEISVNESILGVYAPVYTAAKSFIENYQNNKYTETISDNIEYINKKLSELLETHISFVDFYTSGMLYTLVVDVSAYKFAQDAFSKGVIVDTLNDSKIILCPPYNISKDEIDIFVSVFDKILDELASFDRLK